MPDRVTLQDAINLAADGGAAPTNIGVLLDVGAAQDVDGLDDAALIAEIGARLATVPRLRQVLLPAPFGCGPQYWADAPAFDVTRHVGVVSTHSQPHLDVASDLVTRRLPRNRPLWAARLLVAADGRRSVVAVLHHVVADGLAGFAMLAGLDDRAWLDRPRALPPQGRLPTRRELASDAWHRRAARLHDAGRIVGSSVAGIRELGLDRRPRALPSSSINRPTGAIRRATVVDVPLDPLLVAARARGATLNDAMVAATAGALAALMRRRGENPERLVVSVPIAGRATEHAVGNDVGVLPIEVPASLGLDERIAAVAEVTAARRGVARGSSADLVAVMSVVLAAVGLLRPLLARQRLVSTIESNLRGPAERLRICGRDVERLIPIGFSPGNLGVTFLVCSYAGRLTVTVCADPVVVPKYRELADCLAGELSQLAS